MQYPNCLEPQKCDWSEFVKMRHAAQSGDTTT